MKKKVKGFLIVEFLLSSFLGFFLIIMVYQSYQTVFKSTQYINNDNDLTIQKVFTLYHLEADAMTIVFPQNIQELYKKIAEYKKKYRKEENAVQAEKTNKENKSEKKDDEQAQFKKEFEQYPIFFPRLEKTENKIEISWITSRKLLHKEGLCQVSYLFLLIDRTYEEKKMYRLYRKEVALDKNYNINKNSKEKKYKFINYVTDPKIELIFPDIEKYIQNKKENTEVNKEQNKNKSNNMLTEWGKKKEFKIIQQTKKIEIENFLELLLVPSMMLIEGEMFSFDLKKKTDFSFQISFPNTEYLLDIFLNSLQSKDNKQEQKKQDIIPFQNQNKKNEAPIKENGALS